MGVLIGAARHGGGLRFRARFSLFFTSVFSLRFARFLALRAFCVFCVFAEYCAFFDSLMQILGS